MNLNKAFILGNVTRDPESKAMPSGQQVVSFGVATNRFYSDRDGQKKQDVEFHNVVCFGRLAEIGSRYLNKGSLVLIEGRIKTRNWQDAAGVKHYKTEIIADNLQLGPRSIGGGSSQYNKNNSSFTNTNLSAGGPTPSTQNDIPIIEENYTSPANAEETKNKQDEIDIKDIPF